MHFRRYNERQWEAGFSTGVERNLFFSPTSSISCFSGDGRQQRAARLALPPWFFDGESRREDPLDHSVGRHLHLEYDFFAVIELVLEDVVAVWRLFEWQGVGDDEGRIDVTVLDVLQQRLHIALDVTLTCLDG